MKRIIYASRKILLSLKIYLIEEIINYLKYKRKKHVVEILKI